MSRRGYVCFCAIFFYSHCVSPFSFISRAEVLLRLAMQTHVHIFIFFALRLLRHYLRPSYNCVNLCVCCASGLPVTRSVTSCSTLIDSGCPFSFCCATLIFLCLFLLFQLIFRLFHFSRRPPTSLPVYIKLSLLLLVCLLLRPEIKSWLRLSRRVLLISFCFFFCFTIYHQLSKIIFQTWECNNRNQWIYVFYVNKIA